VTHHRNHHLIMQQYHHNPHPKPPTSIAIIPHFSQTVLFESQISSKKFLPLWPFLLWKTEVKSVRIEAFPLSQKFRFEDFSPLRILGQSVFAYFFYRIKPFSLKR